jgi:hypothetical protein
MEDDVSEHQVIEWLKERRANCLRIGATKDGADRTGWYSDAAYFEAAIMLILGITAQDVYETSLQRDN